MDCKLLTELLIFTLSIGFAHSDTTPWFSQAEVHIKIKISGLELTTLGFALSLSQSANPNVGGRMFVQRQEKKDIFTREQTLSVR